MYKNFEALDEATLQREAIHFSCQCLETGSLTPAHSYLLLLYQRTWPCWWFSLLILTTLELILLLILLIDYLFNVCVCLLRRLILPTMMPRQKLEHLNFCTYLGNTKKQGLMKSAQGEDLAK